GPRGRDARPAGANGTDRTADHPARSGPLNSSLLGNSEGDKAHGPESVGFVVEVSSMRQFPGLVGAADAVDEEAAEDVGVVERGERRVGVDHVVDIAEQSDRPDGGLEPEANVCRVDGVPVDQERRGADDLLNIDADTVEAAE